RCAATVASTTRPAGRSIAHPTPRGSAAGRVPGSNDVGAHHGAGRGAIRPATRPLAAGPGRSRLVDPHPARLAPDRLDRAVLVRRRRPASDAGSVAPMGLLAFRPDRHAWLLRARLAGPGRSVLSRLAAAPARRIRPR